MLLLVLRLLVSLVFAEPTPAQIFDSINRLKTGSPEVKRQAAKLLNNCRYKEVIDALIDTLEREMKRPSLPNRSGDNRSPKQILDPPFVRILVSSLISLRSAAYADEISQKFDGAEDLHRDTFIYDQLRGDMDDLISAFETASNDQLFDSLRSNDSPQATVSIPRREANDNAQGKTANSAPKGTVLAPPQKKVKRPQTPEDIQKSLKAIEERLADQTLEQPEIIDALVSLRRDHWVFSSSPQGAPIMVLMGSEGAGGTQLIQQYVGEVYEDPEAHKDQILTLPVVRDVKTDGWQVFGSSTGFVGSENLPPLIRYLTEHSGGRYLVAKQPTGTRTEFFVVKNPNYGTNKAPHWPAALTPEMAVIYIPNFESWSRDGKDLVLMDALKTGRWKVNNPGSGEAFIEVPALIVISTTEGSELLTSRNPDGTRFGAPLSYEERMKKWREVQGNKKLLKSILVAGSRNSRPNEPAKGISEALLQLIPDDALFLKRPLSPNALKSIVRKKMHALTQFYARTKSAFGDFQIEFDASIDEFIQSDGYDAENNATDIDGKVRSLIAIPLKRAIAEGHFKAAAKGDLLILVSLERNEDNTVTFKATLQNSNTQTVVDTYAEIVPETLARKKRSPLTEKEIAYIHGLEQHLNNNVFGVGPLAIRMTEAYLDREQKLRIDPAARKPEAAQMSAFFGLSSVGKTETAKVLAEYQEGANAEETRIDFSNVTTAQQLKELIFGSYDGYGNPVPSKFMQLYDRKNGVVSVLFDELGNLPKPLLFQLYELFREPVLNGFVDRKARDMSGVQIRLTGNVGQEIFFSVPKDLPQAVRMFAMERFYQDFLGNPGEQRQVLEAAMPPALVNRIGLPNVYWFGPLNFRSLRQLSQLKLDKMLKALLPHEGKMGWNLAFDSEDQYWQWIEAIEEEGFVLDEQGASIDRFVGQVLRQKIESTLIQAGIPSGSDVILKRRSDLDEQSETVESKTNRVAFELNIPTLQRHLTFHLPGAPQMRVPTQSKESKFLVDVHESGHELLKHILFKDQQRTRYLSSLPGVRQINGQTVAFEGIAESSVEVKTHLTAPQVINRVAVLLGGLEAQLLVTSNSLLDAGQTHDLQEANRLIRLAIVVFGLEPRWGLITRDSSTTKVDEFVASLPEKDQSRLKKLTEDWLERARLITRTLLAANLNGALLPMARLLAERGELFGKDFEEFYARTAVIVPKMPSFGVSQARNRVSHWAAQVKSWFSPLDFNHEQVLAPHASPPKEMKSQEELVAETRRKQVQDLRPWPSTRFVSMTKTPECETMLRVAN